MAAKNNPKSSKKHKKSTGNNKNSVRKVNKKEEDKMENKEEFINEVYLMITLVISLLLFLSYINLCGPVGKILNTIVFGTMGLLGYLFPFALFFGVAFGLSNKGSRIATRRLISGIGICFVLTSLIQMISGFDKTIGIIGYFKQCASKRNGGGLLGSLFLKLLYPSVGVVATAIILIALLIIFIVLFTGKTMLFFLQQIGIKTTEWFPKEEIIEEEEQDSLWEEDNEFDKEGKERRPAKIITLQQRKKEELKEEKKSNNSIHKVQNKSNIEMEEITSYEQQNFPIIGDYQKLDEEEKKENQIYEEELKRKFGTQEKSATLEIMPYEGIADMTEISQVQEPQQKDEENTSSFEIDSISDISIFSSKTDSILETPVMSSKTDTVSETPVMSIKIDTVSDIPVFSDKIDTTSDISDLSALPIDIEKLSKEDKQVPIQKPKEPLQPKEVEVTEIICKPEERPFILPSTQLLSKPRISQKAMTEQELKETAMKLQSTLESFGVRVTVTNVSCGPAVTRYELQPEQGVKVSKITSLSDDIKLNLAASDIRIEAPISGKAAVGIEVPNKETSSVLLREILDHKEFKDHKSKIAFAVGKDISGQPVVTDIGKMPHLLIAGATGSGKSVCINTLIMSILYKAKPSEVRLIMIDPKVVELSIYNGIPHLLIPVVTDPKQASAALNWAVTEMTDRYKKFAQLGVRDLRGYNEKISEIEESNDPKYEKLPQIVIIVDELADLMMVASNEVETAICRLAQMARAAGLHLIIATQRPSVNVITGVIKANIPSRIAFAVSSAVDSRTIIDSGGAESLLGRGDMLFFPSGIPKPIRVQGAFISDKEVSEVVDYLKEQNGQTEYNDKLSEHILGGESSENGGTSSANDLDDYFVEAGRFIIEKEKASIGMLQRVYKIGFNRAARIMDQLAQAGVVGPEEGTKPRKILMTMEEFEQYIEEYL